MLKVKTVHYIDGVNVADMSKSDCIAQIAAAEGKIVSLNGIQVESKAITAEIKATEAFIADVVKHLDAK